MQVLLAPLFFNTRFCKHCARIFYRENPGSWLGIHEFDSLPPLGCFESRRGFVPDYPALLMFDEFVVDGDAYERIMYSDREWLQEWRHLLGVLGADGALKVDDVQAAAATHPHSRGAMLRRDLSNPEKWWQAMSYFNALTAQADRLLGESPKTAEDVSWDFDPHQTYGIRGSDGQAHDLSVVLSDSRDSQLPAHRELYETAVGELKRHLREVNACLVACSELGVAPMMWAPYARYLAAKVLGIEAVTSDAGREFFRLAFPAYAPTSAADLARLRKRRAITSLREEIVRASQTGDILDPEYPQRVLSEALNIERSGGRMRRIVGWIATAVGSIPVPGASVAASALGEGTASLLEWKKRKSMRWFYLISDGRGVT